MWTISYATTHFVSHHRGTLPVLLTCPHDGTLDPGVDERTEQSGCPPFSDQRDLYTRLIVQGVAQKLLEIGGEAPYVVIAEFHRKYIDANRSADCAFNDPEAQPFYEEYHRRVRAFVDEIRAEHDSVGLLFDMHGTKGLAEQPADVYVGTDDGRTIARLLAVDPHAMWRRRSVRGYLEAADYPVVPSQPGELEPPALNGGFTVRTYGSSHADGIDAIQLELAPPLRTHAAPRQALIEVLAFVIHNFAAHYAGVHTRGAFRRTGSFGK